MALLTLNPQIKLINGSSSTNYQPIYTLEGRRYGFRFYSISPVAFQPEFDSWNFDIYDPDSNTNVLLGLGIVTGIDLLAYYRYKGDLIPPGVLAVADLQTTKWDKTTQSFLYPRGYDPLEDGFSEKKYSLVYMTSDEAFA